MELHEEFLQLCALSTSGELSPEEEARLQRHLVGCLECRQALREFETVVDIGVPPLIPQLAEASSERMRLISREAATPDRQPSHGQNRANGLAFERRNGNRHASLDWNLGWLSLAATILLTVAAGLYTYRLGNGNGLEAGRVAADSADARVQALEQQTSDAAHERELLEGQLAKRQRTISSLEREMGLQSAVLAKLKVNQNELEQAIKANEDAKQEAAEQSGKLAQQLDVAEESLSEAQKKLDADRQQQAENQSLVADLGAQIDALSSQLHEENVTINSQDDLLAHDRDIRELMGARDLYIAEVYDVARDGKTQKPFGRIFYTRGKSLVFYAYDLEQQPGLKKTSTFQAWGQSRRSDSDALKLGIFYQDNAAKRRWILKVDNPKELAEINAVFVTVEPKGGSDKPTGKRLLYAYLRMAANHP